MTQLTFAFVGLVAGVLYSVALRRRRLHPLTALVLGATGAWVGALTASTLSSGGWHRWTALSLVGAVVGGVGTLAVLDGIVRAVRRSPPSP